jgi:hypothetical protein
MPRSAPFTEADGRAAVAAASCWADALRLLGYTPKGSNCKTLRRWVIAWGIDTDHFDPHAGRRRAGKARTRPLAEVLVANSSYRRGRLKERLLDLGLKKARCEMCGQGEIWRGSRMSLVLDHINGIANDHRLENLRMLCANCAVPSVRAGL